MILKDHQEVILPRGESLFLYNTASQPILLPGNFGEYKFFSASPDSQHIAFFSQTRLHILSAKGKEIWGARINQDKNTPYGIRFSDTGDAIAFIYDHGDSIGWYCITLYDIRYHQSLQLISDNPIGFDSGLRYFLVRGRLSLNRYDEDGTLEYPQSPDLRIKQEAISDKLCHGPVIIDHNMDYLAGFDYIEGWKGCAVKVGGEGFIIFTETGQLQMYENITKKPEIILNLKLDNPMMKVVPFILDITGDIIIAESAIVNHVFLINRNVGLFRKVITPVSVTTDNQRIIIRYNNGYVEVLSEEGLTLNKCQPTAEITGVAAEVIGDSLYIVYAHDPGEPLEIRQFSLK